MALSKLLSRLIFLCIMPLVLLTLLLSGKNIYEIQQHQDEEAWRHVRSLGLAIDRELQSRIAALQVLATSPAIDSLAGLEEIYDEAQRFREIYSGHIILADLSTQMLLNTRVPLGSTLPFLPVPKGFAAAPTVLTTGKPAVGDMFLGPIAGTPLVAIVVPVLDQDQVKALLLNIIETQRYQEIVENITTLPGYSVSILDSIGGLIANNSGMTQDLESTDRRENSRQFLVKSNVSHWSVVIKVPTEIHNKPLLTAAYWLVFALSIAIIISILGGQWMGRRLGNSLESLTGDFSPEHPVTEIEDARALLIEADRARKLSEEETRAKEKLYRNLFEAANVGKSITLPNGEVQLNQAFCDLLGYKMEEVQNLTWQELTPEEDIQSVDCILAKLKSGILNSARFKKRYVHKDGSHMWADVSTVVERDADGNPAYFITTVIDITAQVAIEEKLKSSEELFSAAFRASPAGITITRISDGKFIDANDSFLCMFEFTREEVLDHNSVELKMLSPEVREKLISAQLEANGLRDYELHARSKSGKDITVLFSSQPLQLRGEAFLLTTMIDVTERNRVHANYLSALKYIETVFDKSPIGIATIHADGRILKVNEALVSIVGGEAEVIVNQNINDNIPWHDSGLLSAANQVINSHVEKQGEYRLISSFGKECWLDCLFVPFEYENEQQLLFLMKDVSVQKRVEEESEELQKQLLQAQKMESVGILAGGVAHDLNNMLSVVMGYSELALNELESTDPLYADFKEILDAARRSSNIVRQLLAFARQQTIAPEVLDLNNNIENMLKMLQRLIGEDIDLAWRPGQDLWTVKIDPSQVDQVLANLCINSRDAMQGVGKLTIETSNATFDEVYCSVHPGFMPGNFVMLAVSDTGSGIALELQEKIFDPFFTTKGRHHGTGLGLSTVYGIVKQNEGFINVYSEPGQGTTIKIYFSQHKGQIVEVPPEKTQKLPLSQGETILVVEDDPAILLLCERILKNFKYTILSASIPSEAIELAKENAAKIDLLVTDVVMPEMNGRELSEELKKLCPNLKTLFMSGYTANVIAHRGVLEDGVNFVQKPLSRDEFLRKVRDALSST